MPVASAAPLLMPDPIPSAVPQVASRLGRYTILGRLATGGMATVYLARLQGSGGFSREFALKVIHPHLADEAGFRARFLQEAHVASRIRHPHAVATVDAGEDRGYSYLVLELVDGVTLRQLGIHRDRPFDATEAAVIVAQAAAGLHAMHTVTDDAGHRLGVVHRDVSPHNIMLDAAGRAVLIDLGLAKIESRELTQIGVLCGKLPYMSPEQARMEPLDARSDVFSLGTVFFELLTGQLPFGDENRSTFERLQAPELEPLMHVLAEFDVPAWAQAIVARCLQPVPDDRFACALDVADAIAEALAKAGVDDAAVQRRLAEMVATAVPSMQRVTPCDPLPPRLQQAARRRVQPWMWATAGAALVFLGVIAAGSSIGFDDLSMSERAPEAGTLAADAAEDEWREIERTPNLAPRERKVAPEPVEPEPPLLLEPLASPLPVASVPAPAGRRLGKRPRTRTVGAEPTNDLHSSELKPNPYGSR